MKKLETKGITYSIDGKIIIDGIDISVKEGEFVGIVGPNGCGKSTLLIFIRCLLRTAVRHL